MRAAAWGRPYEGLRIGGTARPGGRALQKGPTERAGEGTRPYGVLYFVGAGHWPAR